MKKGRVLLMLLCLLALPALVLAQGEYSYSILNGKAKITAYSGSAQELTLPDTLGGYPVASIGAGAFKGCTTLKRLRIPEGIESIGSNAFRGCFSLSQLEIPDSVVRIDTHAFHGCFSLKQIVLHDNLERVHALAFYGCSAVRYCDPYSRTACVLTDYGYSFTSPEFPMLALKAYEDDSGLRTFTVADCEESAVSVSFPDGVTTIDDYAFFGCDALADIALPEGVKEIGRAAFEGCAALRRMVVPGSVTKIADDAFSGCTDVTILSPAHSAGQACAKTHEADGFVWQSP